MCRLLQRGNHQGHEYRLYNSAFGGCCDCGVPEGWKPEGFCPLHQQKHAIASVNPLVNDFTPVVSVVLSLLSSKLNKDIEKEHIKLIIEWLRKLCTWDNNARIIICEQLLEKQESSIVVWM